MRAARHCLLVGLVAWPACSPETTPAAAAEPTQTEDKFAADAAAVRVVFRDYRDALLRREGKRVRSFVDDPTIALYQGYLEQARTADRAALERMDWMGKMVVLFLRFELDTHPIETLDGEAVFVMGVDRGWIDAEGVRSFRAADVNVDPDGLHAGLSVTQHPGVPLFDFVKQADGWKLALWKGMPRIEAGVQQEFAKSGYQDPLEWIVKIIETTRQRKFNRKLLDGPWQAEPVAPSE
jgi:hypothetical protein